MIVGKITASQNIWTGSADAAQDTQINGAASGYVDTGGYTTVDGDWTFDHKETTPGLDGNLVYYQGVRADDTVIFTVDWLPCV